MNRGFGIIMALAVLFLGGCLSFGGGSSEAMVKRGQQICNDTNGEWVDGRCVYPAWQMVDTTASVLGIRAE